MARKAIDPMEVRPSFDCDGKPIGNGDLIEIVSRGFLFHAYIDDDDDDDADDQAVPARDKDKELEQWFDSLDWASVRLLKKAGEIYLWGIQNGLKTRRSRSNALENA